MSSGYKAQYKGAANQQWQTKLTGTEPSALSTMQRLREQYPFARVVDEKGNVVAS